MHWPQRKSGREREKESLNAKFNYTSLISMKKDSLRSHFAQMRWKFFLHFYLVGLSEFIETAVVAMCMCNYANFACFLHSSLLLHCFHCFGGRFFFHSSLRRSHLSYSYMKYAILKCFDVNYTAFGETFFFIRFCMMVLRCRANCFRIKLQNFKEKINKINRIVVVPCISFLASAKIIVLCIFDEFFSRAISLHLSPGQCQSMWNGCWVYNINKLIKTTNLIIAAPKKNTHTHIVYTSFRFPTEEDVNTGKKNSDGKREMACVSSTCEKPEMLSCLLFYS